MEYAIGFFAGLVIGIALMIGLFFWLCYQPYGS